MILSPLWRKLMLTVHVATSMGFLGAVAAFLALAIAGATTADMAVMLSVYVAMAVVTWDVIVPLAFGSLVIGVIQSVVTPWGLFRHYWVIIKLVLTTVATVVLMLQTQTVNALASAAMAGDVSRLSQARLTMVVHGGGGLVVLLVATVLSVYKPRGLTRYGSRQAV
jgi:hypothetical protein